MPSVTACTYDRTTASAEVGELNTGTYTIGYLVETDGLMGPQSVANAALLASPNPLPSLWTSYSYQGDTDALSYARQYSVTRDPKSVKLYYITVTYMPPEPGENPTDNTSGTPINSEPIPTQRDPVYWWDREVFTERVEKDTQDPPKPIRNFAAGYYETDIELERTNGVLVVEFNVATLSKVIFYSRTFDGAVNSAPWTVNGITVPARAGLCREVSSGPPNSEQGYRYYHLVFRFSIAREGRNWDVPKMEYGQYHWEKDANGEYRTTVANFRTRVDAKTPVPLNEDGTRRDDLQDVLYTDWRVRPEVNFNDLPF